MGGKLPIVFMAIALAVIGGGIALMGRIGNEPPANVSENSDSQDSERSTRKHADQPLAATATFNVSEKLDSGVNLITEIAEVAERLHDPDRDPVEDLRTVDEIIEFHTRLFKSVPGGGENDDVMRNLTGGNERRIALIHPDHPAINDRGELVDRWGTPFHFHQISSQQLEVRSAGPDGALYTEDDILREGQDRES